MSIKQKLSLGAFAAAVMAAASPAQAGSPTAEQLNRMAPAERVAAIKALAAQQKARVKVAGLDTTAPSLTAFQAGARVDVSSSVEQLTMSLAASDDLSGIDSISVGAVGPSGQRVYAYSNGHAGMQQVKARLAFSLSPFAQAGTWHIESVHVSDINQNWSYLDEAALKLLGNTEFEVLSTSADLEAPTLTGGKILTPEVSVSRPARGTADKPSSARVLLNVTDAGTDAVSGPAGSYPSFCLRDRSVCIFFGSYGQGVYGIRKFAEVLGNPYLSDTPPGEYLLESVVVSDHAGNFREYTSTVFGGETDFSQLFPSTTLTIKP